MIITEKNGKKILIRTNFIRPVPNKDYYYVTYNFDPDMDIEMRCMRNLIFSYLVFLRNLDLEARTSIRELIEICGLGVTQNYKRTSFYMLMEKSLESMVSDGFIEPLDKPFSKHRINDLLIITFIEENFYLSIKSDGENRMSGEPFFIVSDKEFEKITATKKYEIPKLFYVYCYIKTRIWNRKHGESPEENPSMFFESFESMAERFHVGYKTIQKYILCLCEIGLLKAGKLTTHAPGKKAPNVYVLNEDGWETELNNAIHYLDEKRQNNETL